MTILGNKKDLKETFNVESIKRPKKWPNPEEGTIIAYGLKINGDYRLMEIKNEQAFDDITTIDIKNVRRLSYFKLTPK